MIQRHIDSLADEGYVWHSGVYRHSADSSGCGWNVEVNCNHDALSCGPVISDYIDAMRTDYGLALTD